MLELQSESSIEPAAVEVLKSMSLRVHNLATIHHLLRADQLDHSGISLRACLRALANSFEGTGYDAYGVDIRLDAEEMCIGPNLLTAIGMVTNELLTNTAKHARRPGGRTEVHLTAGRLGDDDLVLRYRDNGPAPTDLFGGNPEDTSTLGTYLIHTMVDQVGGQLAQAGTATGLDLTIRIPVTREGNLYLARRNRGRSQLSLT